jgi:hypothetical protein
VPHHGVTQSPLDRPGHVHRRSVLIMRKPVVRDMSLESSGVLLSLKADGMISMAEMWMKVPAATAVSTPVMFSSATTLHHSVSASGTRAFSRPNGLTIIVGRYDGADKDTDRGGEREEEDDDHELCLGHIRQQESGPQCHSSQALMRHDRQKDAELCQD